VIVVVLAVPVAFWLFRSVMGHADRMSDAIHPNDQGHQMIADRLEPALRDLLRADE
jgi:lysophospholipase L1-like esterase